MVDKRTRPAWRWAVPGAVVAVALGATALSGIAADATTTLPPRSAAELLVDVQSASVTGLSGTVVQNAALGLPELPVQVGGQGSSSFGSLVSGSHTLRVWAAGPERQRLALLGTLGESDIVRNGRDVWTWSSDENAATHYRLADRAAAAPTIRPDVAAMTPQQAADAALAAIDPSTRVSTDGTATVAGRDAYELVLLPRDTGSLVGQVRIAIDGEHRVPLRVQVFARDAVTAAFEVGFTQVSFDVPGDEQFAFTPPPGATVTESSVGLGAGPTSTVPVEPVPVESGPVDSGLGGVAAPRIVGSGWTAVLVTTRLAESPSAGQGTRDGRASGLDLTAVLDALPRVSGDWGTGRLLQSALFSVLITDDGRVLAGAVPADALYRAAG